MRHKEILLRAALGLAVVGCARGSHVTVDPAAVAALHADLRLVGGETTWVTRGTGYELVGRSRTDLVALKSALDRDAATFHRVFPNDSIVPVVATVRRVLPPGKPYVAAAPVPPDTKEAVVELLLVDPKAKKDDASRRGMNEAEIAAFAVESPTNAVVRAWL